jgi:geranylgeranyl diphosphate synthase type II
MQNEYIDLIERYLQKSVPNNELSKSMEYSLLAGGKRIRPTLLLEFYKLCCNGSLDYALPYACAIEMIHTYSLIHDDLPCMDNDNMRRGKPSNHIKFGEDIALLSGDALLNLAFETMLCEENARKVGAEKALKASYALAKAAGSRGMILGQMIDLEGEGKNSNINKIIDMYNKKTGNLIEVAPVMGCYLAGADKRKTLAASTYGKSIGLAFQIVDDILDVTADCKELGKPVGSDHENNKCTYLSIVGMDRAREDVNILTKSALKSLEHFDSDTEFLKNLALLLERRSK